MGCREHRHQHRLGEDGESGREHKPGQLEGQEVLERVWPKLSQPRVLTPPLPRPVLEAWPHRQAASCLHQRHLQPQQASTVWLLTPREGLLALLRHQREGSSLGQWVRALPGAAVAWIEAKWADTALAAPPASLHQPDLDSVPVCSSYAELRPAWHRDKWVGSRASTATGPPAWPQDTLGVGLHVFCPPFQIPPSLGP